MDEVESDLDVWDVLEGIGKTGEMYSWRVTWCCLT